MLEKAISKAITAQVFAQSLEKKLKETPDSLRTDLKSSKTLHYILDAIYHVTEPQVTSHAD